MLMIPNYYTTLIIKRKNIYFISLTRKKPWYPLARKTVQTISQLTMSVNQKSVNRVITKRYPTAKIYNKKESSF